ncbi:MAG: hypothetical protein JNJ59_26450 [Deltaproteobacteria bacterium]|nr:hypothetical protein [Deltaproteobacteria bacterium]
MNIGGVVRASRGLVLALFLVASALPSAFADDPTDAGDTAAEPDATAGEADATAGEQADAATSDAATSDAVQAEAADAGASPDAGPAADAGAAAAGPAGSPHDEVPPMSELMPDAADMQPVDLDGDGVIDPEEEPLTFDVPDGLAGADFLASFTALVEKMREKIITKMIYKTTQKQSKTMGLLMMIMLGLTAAGVFILLTPLFLAKKYPGKEKLVWKGALLATFAYISTMLVFTGAVFLLRTAKNETAMLVNPPLAIANASFDAIHDQVAFLTSAPGGEDDVRVLLEPPIAALAAGSEDGMLEAVLDNVSQFKEDFSVFKALANFFKGLGWLFASVSTILVIVAVVMFMLSQKSLLRDILRLPTQVAGGDVANFGAAFGTMQKRTGKEVLALVLAIGVLLASAFIAGFLLYMALTPAVAALFDYLMANIAYVLTPGDASRLVVYGSLFGYGIFLGLVVVLIILGNAFFVGKFQKVIQQKFRHGIPAPTYKKFWLWGPLAAIWVQVLPVAILFLSSFVLDKMFEGRSGDMSWETALLVGPLGQLVALPLLFWIFQGFRALKFLLKFDHLVDSPEKKAAKLAKAVA